MVSVLILFGVISYKIPAIFGQQVTSRVHMDEDEMLIHFFQFDGNEKFYFFLLFIL